MMRDLQKDTRAVAGIDFTTARAPVVEVVQHLQCLLDNRVRFPAFDIGDKTDAASVVFIRRIVKPLFRR